VALDTSFPTWTSSTEERERERGGPLLLPLFVTLFPSCSSFVRPICSRQRQRLFLRPNTTQSLFVSFFRSRSVSSKALYSLAAAYEASVELLPHRQARRHRRSLPFLTPKGRKPESFAEVEGGGGKGARKAEGGGGRAGKKKKWLPSGRKDLMRGERRRKKPASPRRPRLENSMDVGLFLPRREGLSAFLTLLFLVLSSFHKTLSSSRNQFD
jgi:hypothetical protein